MKQIIKNSIATLAAALLIAAGLGAIVAIVSSTAGFVVLVSVIIIFGGRALARDMGWIK